MGAFSLEGNDWLGIGATGSAAYQGTDDCGSRPNCISLWSRDCKSRKDDFERCRRESNERNAATTEELIELKKRELELEKRRGKGERNKEIIKMVLVVGAIVFALWLLFK